MKVKVGITFIGATYQYIYYTNLELKYGDYVLVDSSNGLGLAKVTNASIHINNNRPCYSWVLQKVDLESLRNNLRCELKAENEAQPGKAFV